ncbi:hypothetical protein SAY86_027923 [Trapa natans]|uniref:Uncharacterized protein n=1 Tax=Trapa natans TaxID=22666 RepID=A0AAN7M062_TRANT|nr:hypothetical protein SAY86_027923 [Trapa natans]
MAHGWVKSLQCKSRAFEDVHDRRLRRPGPPASSSCRSGSQALKDVVVDSARQKQRNPKACQGPLLPQPAPTARRKSTTKTKTAVGPRAAAAALSVRTTAGLTYPALSELPEGHTSRRVVEIIFHSSWGPKPFPGKVEMIFKVQNGPRATARFEEYREAVKSVAWEDDARCIADGNEVMRFQCVGPMPAGCCSGAINDYSGVWGSLQVRKAAAVCTFAGSARAHEGAGGGRGRRAMLVCRVIAGRVSKREVVMDSFQECQVGFNSAGGENGELLVYDARAVLHCFLIIYKL